MHRHLIIQDLRLSHLKDLKNSTALLKKDSNAYVFVIFVKFLRTFFTEHLHIQCIFIYVSIKICFKSTNDLKSLSLNELLTNKLSKGSKMKPFSREQKVIKLNEAHLKFATVSSFIFTRLGNRVSFVNCIITAHKCGRD